MVRPAPSNLPPGADNGSPTTQLTGENQAVWKRWATDVCGGVIQSGHFIAEEKPQEVPAALVSFLGGSLGQFPSSSCLAPGSQACLH